MAGKGPQPQAEKVKQNTLGRAGPGEESRPKWRSLGVVQGVFGLCAVSLGAKADESLQTEEDGHERVRNMVNIIFILEEGRMPVRNARGWTVEGEKKE